ncbi:CRISPR system Cascade subunit CasC [Murinocardiopsis flavida]|uniref:CRISPR system Cascade subunit CasC n=1 Tax=Murinocardiopsis flavida TaxID=645275 RepID=A0A2P8CWQ5_9ACTN|nr:type I-E CRISPR-associated protein Cas7/Cse4/CasC [Murinocardiopsis flavida]PSK89412.1 CRISPR system Cascade subunit CasC [Murinocardiopsis flavida]
MIIELHLIQSFPTSNLNRDDLGQPKSVTFGGALRSRVSSQCLKRSARDLFEDVGLAEGETAVRTKRLLQEAAVQMAGKEGATVTDEHETVVREALRQMGFELDTNDLTQYLLFVGKSAVTDLADYCAANKDSLVKAAAKRAKEKKEKKDKPTGDVLDQARKILNARKSVDIALFGRMIADNKDFNIDAASQVAHAISTHSVGVEYDFYTAVDDLKPEAEAGADMIGTVDFNAACYYRYANLDLAQLRKNLFGKDATDVDEDLVERATSAWLNAFIRAVPSGKQNSMAARTMPDTLLAVVRDSGAWNLANAFLKPVDSKEASLKDLSVMDVSTERLWEHFERLRGFYGEEEVRKVAMASVSGSLDWLDVREDERAESLAAFTGQVMGAVRG